MNISRELDTLLKKVEKPARYIGGEINTVSKNPENVKVRFGFAFPDTYEIGMSYTGLQLLYNILNKDDEIYCERVFAPAMDMEEAMKANNLPLWALESQDAVKDFDMIAFTIGYEMCYTNILNMLMLSGVPLRAADRKGLKNIVFAGGVCAYNPEPLADFIDFFFVDVSRKPQLIVQHSYDTGKGSITGSLSQTIDSSPTMTKGYCSFMVA